MGKKDVHHCGSERPEDKRKQVLSESEKANIRLAWEMEEQINLFAGTFLSLSLYAYLINQFQAKTKHDLFLQHSMQGIYGKLSPTKMYKSLEKFQTTPLTPFFLEQHCENLLSFHGQIYIAL